MTWMVAILRWGPSQKTSCEALAELFEVYSPKIRRLIVKNCRREWHEEWLFGRYVFIRKISNWREAFRHKSILTILTSGNDPAIVPSTEIDRLKDMEDNDGFVVLQSKPRFRRGDDCRISEGSFAGYLAVYHGMGRRDRELALVSYMGRQVQVEVAAGALVPA